MLEIIGTVRSAVKSVEPTFQPKTNLAAFIVVVKKRSDIQTFFSTTTYAEIPLFAT